MTIKSKDWVALAKHCKSKRGATQDIKWDSHPVYSVGGKMFCIFSADPVEADMVSLPAHPERFLDLTEIEGVMPAAYLSRYKWVSVDASTTLTPAQMNELVDAAYKRVFDKLPGRTRRLVEAGKA